MLFLVKTSGLEPPTPCMSSRYSNQLSYAFVLKHSANQSAHYVCGFSPLVETVGFEPMTLRMRTVRSPN